MNGHTGGLEEEICANQYHLNLFVQLNSIPESESEI